MRRAAVAMWALAARVNLWTVRRTYIPTAARFPLPPGPLSPSLPTHALDENGPNFGYIITAAMNEPWSRGDRIAIAGVLLTAATVVAALIVIPEVRNLLGLRQEQRDYRQRQIETPEVIADKKSAQMPSEKPPSQSTLSQVTAQPTPRTKNVSAPQGRKADIRPRQNATENVAPAPTDVYRSSSYVPPPIVQSTLTANPVQAPRDEPSSALAPINARPPPIHDTTPLTAAEILKLRGPGRIPGLEGALDPIKDSGDRTYLYADNIAIDGGKSQPVDFALGQVLILDDALGHSFQVRVLSINSEAAIIEYRSRLLPDGNVRASLNIAVVNDALEPIKGADVYIFFRDNTFLSGKTDSGGRHNFPRLKGDVIAVYCAHRLYAAFVLDNAAISQSLLIKMSRDGGGSLIINTVGSIPGLDGSLDPKSDTTNGLYLYADDIDVNNGQRQPADLKLRVPFELRDKRGERFRVEIVGMKESISLLNYSHLGRSAIAR